MVAAYKGDLAFGIVATVGGTCGDAQDPAKRPVDQFQAHAHVNKRCAY